MTRLNASKSNDSTHKKGRLSTTLGLCFALATAPFSGAYAQSTPPIAPSTAPVISLTQSADIAHVSELHLAYVISSDTRINNYSQDGLESLAQTLNNRTSIEPAGVVGIDLERDEIALFPFIYWPISASDTPLSETARQKVQSYIDHGGMILFDVRDLRTGMASTQAIANVTGRLNIRPVEDMPQDHTLTRSFYLLSTLRGSFNYDDVLVEEAGTPGTESVSNVIIGENNWAAAWAGRTVRQGTNEYEMALRAGVNMLMYALTGEYKSDQLHINNTLDRLSR